MIEYAVLLTPPHPAPSQDGLHELRPSFPETDSARDVADLYAGVHLHAGLQNRNEK